MSRPSGVSRNLRTGVGWSLFVATAYSIFVIVLTHVRGDAALAALGVRLPTLILLYYVGAVLVGSVVGLLLPLASTTIGAAFVGAIAALPLFTLLEVNDALAGRDPLPGWRYFAIILALIVGAVAGIAVRSMRRFR
jgi:hypothetical protein